MNSRQEIPRPPVMPPNLAMRDGDQPRAEPKPQDSARLPRDHEKEKIKRQLYNLIDRIDKL